MLSQNKIKPVLASEKECTGCLACVNICPKDALVSYMGDDGHTHVSIDTDKCIGCKSCERVCSSSRNNFGNNELNKSKIFAAWSFNMEERKNATSGGVFAALARVVIEKGGAVVGAAFDGRECRHIMITDIQDIQKLQGSKYMASSMDGIYKLIEKELSHRIVLFSGVGCQCAGVMAFFEHSSYKKNLITVDLVCGGSPSHILLDKFYEHYPKVEKIVSFREKDKYQLRVLEHGKVRIVKDKSLPLHGFNCELTNRYTCYNCQFACAHRMTDITIGDLWNYGYMKEEHSRGISTVIIHTDIGMSLIESADLSLNKLEWEQSIRSCKRIVWGRDHIFSPRRKLVKNAETMSYEKFKKLYCISMKPKDISLEIFRIYRFIVRKIIAWKAKKYLNSLLEKYKDNNKIR